MFVVREQAVKQEKFQAMTGLFSASASVHGLVEYRNVN